MEIIREETHEFTEEYRIEFSYPDGGGFVFDCDKFGNILDTITSEQAQVYEKCKSNPEMKMEILDHSRSYTHPAVGKCCCNQEVALGGFTNSCCKCGREYNSFGQLLSRDDRNQREENIHEERRI